MSRPHEVCEQCEGVGSISYNPNLNPSAFPSMASAKCRHCGGTGSVGKTKPQENKKLCNDAPASGSSARSEATPKP